MTAIALGLTVSAKILSQKGLGALGRFDPAGAA